MAVSNLVAPSNIACWSRGSQTPKLKFGKIETGSANTIPGALMIKGTSIGEFAYAGAGATRPLGWLGFEDCPAQYIDGHTVSTAYSTDDLVALLFGGSFGIMAILADSQTILEGDFLVAAATGEVAKATAIVVTVTTGSTTVMADKAAPDEAATGGIPTEGIIVARAYENKTTSGANARLMAWSMI